MLVAACACLLIGTCTGPARAQAPAPGWELDGVGRVVAISDLHGAHRAFVETLQAAGVLDASAAWAGGKTHLVVVGDIVDRGDDSRASMDLLMRLEPQAIAAGGRVHVVLGNHDVMNLIGDLRYVTRGEFAAFAAEESAEDRDAAYARYLASVPAQASPLGRAEFDARFPPGFFAHREAFSASGEYGRWLLGKPLALRLDDTLFVHAGVSAALQAGTLRDLNGALRDELIEYATLLEQLTDRGTLDPTQDFYAVPAALGAAEPAEATADPAEVAARDPADAAAPDPAVARLLALHDSALHSPNSPLWYRGNVGCGPLVEQERLAQALRGLGAKRVVIGHTPTFQRQAWRRLDDQVWMIDTGMQRDYYSGQGAALLLEGGTPTVVYQGAGKPVPVDALPARAGVLSANLAPDELEAALASGDIIGRGEAPSGELLTIRWRNSELRALLLPGSGTRGLFPEVAAYRIDRLLDLAMVPTAVVRTVDGKPATVQHLPASLVPEARRAAGEVRVEAWCPLQDQWQAMVLFDALIGNGPRTAEHVQYVAANGQLVLTGHQGAFAASPGIPAHLRNASLGVSGPWKAKLADLESQKARDMLRDVLPARQYEALAKRARTLAK
jgi:hypothetical protein